jgi:4-amino-4-deoxy-L-arabinose transferase-like glycosyltransferase
MRYRTLLLLLCLLLLAFGLRTYRLDGQEIWGDEACSITIALFPFAQVFSGNMDTHPPLHHMLLWATVRVAGESPFAIRFPSVLAGMMVVPLMYRLGKLIRRETGILAAVFAAVSSFLIYYSQEARSYALSLAGSTGSMLTFWMALYYQQKRESVPLWLWGGYALSSLVAVYSHYYAFAVLLAEAIFVIGTIWKDRHLPRILPWLVVWGGMALCFLPWAIHHSHSLQGKASARFAEWNFAKFGEITARTLLAYGVGKTLPVGVQRWGWGIVGIALLGLGRTAAWGHRRMAVFLGLVLLGGLLFAWGINPLMPFFEERYLLVCAPSFLLLTAIGLSGWKRMGTIWAVVGISFIGVLNALSLWHYHNNPAFLKSQYGSVMADIAAQAQEGDLILLNNPLQASLFEYYRPEGMSYRFIPPDVLLTEEEAERFLQEATAGYQRAWLVDFGNPQEYDPAHRARAWLARHAYLGLRQDYLGATLSLFILETPSGIEHPVDILLGDEIRLRGYSIKPEAPSPGDFLLLTLYWEALHPISHSYTVFVHLLSQDGRLVAQIDTPPVGGAFPTSEWVPGEEIVDHYAIQLPPDLPPGPYQLNAGMYLWPAMTRLPVLKDGQVIGDFIPLGSLEILPRGTFSSGKP